MIAVVTGGASGLGKIFTRDLVYRGYTVYALYKTSISSALELESEKIHTIRCDVSNEEDVKRVFEKIGKIDLLINNAAISCDNHYLEKTKEEFLKVIETNLVGPFLTMKYAKFNIGGLIINISSDNAINSFNPLSMDYDASKAGLNILTKDFAAALDCRVVGVCPGWINTDTVLASDPKYIESELKRVNQSKLIDKDMLVKYILGNKDNMSNGEIIVIKELNDERQEAYKLS